MLMISSSLRSKVRTLALVMEDSAGEAIGRGQGRRKYMTPKDGSRMRSEGVKLSGSSSAFVRNSHDCGGSDVWID